MYENYFGLIAKPFELVPNPLFLFNSTSHKKAISYLKYGLQERVGFILLAGEVGSGKTTIIRDIIKNLDDDIALSQVLNTSASASQILAMINEDFGLEVNGKDKVALLRDLNDHLLALYAQRKRAVIIIDEAQNLSIPVLEEVRLLSNLEAENAKLVQIVLVGQPELQKIITQPELRQLRQRISIHCRLDPLSRKEVEEYIYHRLATAGNRNAVRWEDGTFDSLFTYSGGIPRSLNVYCDFVLLCAYVEKTRVITLEMINEVLGDLSWEQMPPAPAQDSLVDKRGKVVKAAPQIAPVTDHSMAKCLEEHTVILQNLSDHYNEMTSKLDAGFASIHRQLDVVLAAVVDESELAASKRDGIDKLVKEYGLQDVSNDKQ